MDVVFSQEEPLGKTSLISVGEPDGSETVSFRYSVLLSYFG